MAIDSSAPRSRRTILLAAIGGAGAAVAASLGRAAPVAADDNDPILLGVGSTATENDATLPTIVNSSASPGFAVVTDAAGSNAKTAINGTSGAGVGVFGISNGPIDPPTGRSTGVIGITGGGAALDVNLNTDFTGVYGFSEDETNFTAAGVWGDTITGAGVVGTGFFGVYGTGAVGIVGNVDGASNGVYGFAGDDSLPAPAATSVGVLGTAGAGASTGVRGHAALGAAYGVIASAASTTQTALYVAGKLKLSRSGRTSIGSTSTSRKVTMAGVTSTSYVIATLQTSISGCYVRAVVPTTGSFTIYLSKAPGKTAVVGYVVVN